MGTKEEQEIIKLHKELQEDYLVLENKIKALQNSVVKYVENEVKRK